MQKLLLSIFISFSILSAGAQTMPSIPGMPGMTMEEMKKLATMSPAEQEAFKKKMLKAAEAQLKKTANAANITYDETILPTTVVAQPVKDLKRLSTLPSAPLSRTELLKQTAKMEAAIKTVIEPAKVAEIEKIATTNTAGEMQAAAIGGWLSNNPAEALLAAMKSTQKDPSNLQGWNNLAALYNMVGMEQHAIPILQNCLVEKPDNSMFLNNMGQAYLGLGDLSKATQYLTRCLTIDELHPEANHSMAMISMFQNDIDKAQAYFAKELEIAQRRSTLAQLAKSGRRDRINLPALYKKKKQHSGIGEKNFFEEISLSKFQMPDAPDKVEDVKAWKAETAAFINSVAAEQLFWISIPPLTDAQLKAEGKKYFGIYHDLVDELIRELGNTYIPLLALVEEDDVQMLTQMEYDYYAALNQVKCPEPPDNVLRTSDLMRAYELKCCELKKPIVTQYMNKRNDYIMNRFKLVQGRYKEYLNALINVVQLDPSEANKRLVYANVGAYFGFLAHAYGAIAVPDLPIGCHDDMTPQEADEIIMSARDLKLECPSWLKLKLSVKFVTLSADCQSYNVEASIYKVVSVGGTKNFKTGTSTIYVGAGIDGSFKFASGKISQQLYVVFDQNNDFSDVGIRGGASGNISGAISGNFGYDFSMNSGFNAQGKVESPWLNKWEKAINFVTKK